MLREKGLLQGSVDPECLLDKEVCRYSVQGTKLLLDAGGGSKGDNLVSPTPILPMICDN